MIKGIVGIAALVLWLVMQVRDSEPGATERSVEIFGSSSQVLYFPVGTCFSPLF